MKRNLLVLVLIAVLVLGSENLSWAQCPEDPMDLGQCDTLHVLPLDNAASGQFPRPVHVSLLVTHDSTTFYNESQGTWMQDSISGFFLCLGWSGSAWLPADSNNASLYGPEFSGSVFRDFGGIPNRMLGLYEIGEGQEWDTRIINLGGGCPFSMVLVPTGYPDQKWWEGGRVLLATLTFLASDTTTICIDTASYMLTRTVFSRPDAQTYIPRDSMPVCFGVYSPIGFSADPTEGQCPLPVQFTDQSLGEPTSWFWDFGDGDTSTQQNPLHVYLDTGYFDVKLIVSKDTLVDSLVQEAYIHVEENHSWVHMRGWPEICYGETLSYYISVQNTHFVTASPCSLTLNTTSHMRYVSSDPPGILLNDSTVLWVFDSLMAGGIRQIEVWETMAETTAYKQGAKRILQGACALLKLRIPGPPGYYAWLFCVTAVKLLWPHSWVDVVAVKEGERTMPFLDEWYPYVIRFANIGHEQDAQQVKLLDYIRVERPRGFLYSGCAIDVTSDDPGVEIQEISPGDWKVSWPEEPTLEPTYFYFNYLNWPRRYVDIYVPADWEGCAPAPDTVWVKNTVQIVAYNENEDRKANNTYSDWYPIVIPLDPNEMRVNPSGFIRPGEILLYQVFFENEGTGTADSIRIVSVLDTNLLDYALVVPDTTAKYIPYTRELIWDFPDINLEPDSSGHVFYWIRAADSLESGTEIKGNAVIYFENLPGVPCSTSVTVDALTPVSYVDSVVRVGFPDTFTVWWSGYDPFPGASGITLYSLYYSEDEGSDSLWFADTSWFGDDTLASSATFIGQPGRSYCFYSVAEDYVGWIEEAPGVADACTPFLHGDANADWLIDIADVVFLINYLYRNGEAPNPVERGDANCNGEVTVGDIVYLISYLYRNGPPPPC